MSDLTMRDMNMNDVSLGDTLVHRLLSRAAQRPHEVAYDVLPRGAAALSDPITWGMWAERSRALAQRLIALGLQPGECALIFADNHPLWPIADAAVLLARGVSVGAYPTSAVAQLSAQLRDCNARIAFVDTSERAGMLKRAAADVPWPVQVVSAHDVMLDATSIAPESDGTNDAALELSERIASIAADDVALLIYTSGSTGEPKGARITHRYLLASAQSIATALELSERDTGVSFLPFCHAAERVFGMYVRIAVGMRAVLVESPDDVWTANRLFAPTIFGGLPRLFEKIAARMHDAPSQAAASAIVAGMVGRLCRVATSGGATLTPTVAEQLRDAGLTVLGAYGQTEHLCIAMNRPSANRLDAVGLPMPGTEVRLAEGGELLVRRSALTFSGYHAKPDATRDAFTPDGEWLRTGDLAEQDADGMLRITGRIKELIALSNGKKVAPLPIEAELAASPLINAALCVGEGHPFLSAILQLDRDAIEDFSHTTMAEDGQLAAEGSSSLMRALADHVALVNSTRSRPEQIREFVVTTDEWSVENGAFTPTHKIRRAALLERYQPLIAPLYARQSVSTSGKQAL